MSASAFQRVALISCVVLCCVVIFPKVFVTRSTKEKRQPQEARPNQLSPMTQHPMISKSNQQWSAHSHLPKSHQSDSIAKAKGGNGGGNKSFMAQIIPVYGFGLLMYILYILFKISSKASTQNPRVRKRCAGTRHGNMKRKITDYELAQLQAKLKETEVAMKQIASKMGTGSDKFTNDTSEQEENLLRQLKEITRVMKEQKFIGGIGSEKETEDSSYMEHCEGYPEETHQSRCSCQHDINYSEPSQPSAKELEDKIEDKCLFNETMEDKLRQNHKYQAISHQKGAQISTHADGVEGEDLHYENWKDLVHESDDSAVKPEEAGVSLEDHCNVGSQIRDDSNLDPYASELQHVITFSDEGALRKRNKMAIE